MYHTTTVKGKLKEMLISRGMFDSQAEEVLQEAIPVLNAEFEATKPEDYERKITFDRPSEEYPDVMYGLWFKTVKPIALKWILKNKPHAWFKDMFVD